MAMASVTALTTRTEDLKCKAMTPMTVGAVTTKKQNPGFLQKSLNEYFHERVDEHVKRQGGDFKGFYYVPSAEFAAARKEITCLDQKIDQARATWNVDKEVFVHRWKEAVDRQNEIYKRLPQLNPYFKETFGKRERAVRIVALEKDQCLQKDVEIRKEKKELDKLIEVKANVEHRLKKFSIYKTYLESAKDASQGEYPDIKNLIDRYGILAGARDELMNRNESFRDTVTMRQRALDDDILMKSNEVLAYRNYLSELMEYDTTLQEQVFRLDDSLLRIKTTAAQRTLVIGQIKMAIRNMYLQVCKSLHRHAKIAPEDTLGQLLDVRLSIREMVRLTQDIRRMLKAAHQTARNEELTRIKNVLIATEKMKRMDKLMPKIKMMDVREIFGLPPLKQKLPDNISQILLARKI